MTSALQPALDTIMISEMDAVSQMAAEVGELAVRDIIHSVNETEAERHLDQLEKWCAELDKLLAQYAGSQGLQCDAVDRGRS